MTVRRDGRGRVAAKLCLHVVAEALLTLLSVAIMHVVLRDYFGFGRGAIIITWPTFVIMQASQVYEWGSRLGPRYLAWGPKEVARFRAAFRRVVLLAVSALPIILAIAAFLIGQRAASGFLVVIGGGVVPWTVYRLRQSPST